MTGIGSNRIIASCAMSAKRSIWSVLSLQAVRAYLLIPAFVNHIAIWFIQCPFGMDLSHEKAIGLHIKILLKTSQAPHAITNPSTPKQALWKRRTGKMRRYWTRIDTLVKARLRL
jgi:hypothetical protein